MSKPTDITIIQADLSFEPVAYRVPQHRYGQVIGECTLVNVEVRVETRNGRKDIGFGSMPLGPVQGWPSAAVPSPQAVPALREFAQEIAELANDFPDFAHPVDIVLQFSGEYDHLAQQVQKRMKLAEPLSPMAQRLASSAFDAALHDAYGRVLGLNSYDALTRKHMNADLADYLDKDFAGEYLDKYTARHPKPRVPIFQRVGLSDALADSSAAARKNDPVPMSVAGWIKAGGLTHFKIELAGEDVAADLARFLEVDRTVLDATPADKWSTVQYVFEWGLAAKGPGHALELLTQLRQKAPEGLARVLYLGDPAISQGGQPDAAQIKALAAIKPVLTSGTVLDYEGLLQSRDHGYSGLAVYACHGHTDVLLLAAAAQKHKLWLTVDDLTCPGFSYLQSASLAARLPTAIAFEGSSRQYCPAANRRWQSQFPGMFDVQNGTVATSLLDGLGLGF